MILTYMPLQANIKKGQKIYLKKFKSACDMSGIKFAHKHTQDEWESYFEAGELKDEILKICPNAKIKEKWLPHIYDFSYEFASDSGNIPSC